MTRVQLQSVILNNLCVMECVKLATHHVIEVLKKEKLATKDEIYQILRKTAG